MIAFTVETATRTYRNISAEDKCDAAAAVAKLAYGGGARVRFVANHPKARRGASSFAAIREGREVDVHLVTYY